MGKAGRKNYAAQMAQAIAELTDSGLEMIETAMAIMRDPLEEGKTRLAASQFLSERMAGRAAQTIEMDVTTTVLQGRDPELLTDAQLKQLETTLDAMLGDAEAEIVDEVPSLRALEAAPCEADAVLVEVPEDE